MTSPEADSAPVISGPNLQVPNVDLLSWVFGNEEYHEDKPVSNLPLNTDKQLLIAHSSDLC